MAKYTGHSKFMKNLHANRTPEQKAAIAKKTSESIKAWHAKMKEEKKRKRNRKISATQQERHSQIPPRMKRDINRKKSKSFKKFDKTLKGREQRKYLGYLSRQDILNCEPERKARIIEKRTKGIKKKWDSLTPEQKRERISISLKKGEGKKKKIQHFYEKDVPRKKDYCGVVTEKEMELMYG